MKFERVFKQAKKDGFYITMYCDIDQKDSIDNKIGLTCCPVSNGFVTSDMKGKEIRDLLRKV